MNVQPYIISSNKKMRNVEEWLALATQNNIDFFSNRAQLISDLVAKELPCYQEATQQYMDCTFLLIYLSNPRDRRLLILSENKSNILSLNFEGDMLSYDGLCVQSCKTNRHNNLALRSHFSFSAPSPTLSLIKQDDSAVSFGLGDRLGIASFGHLALFSQYTITPILAQQSKRELNLTGRTYADIIEAASWDVFAYNYTSPWGADGDHLKSSAEITEALEMGCTMITADLSDNIENDFLLCSEKTLEKSFESLPLEMRTYLDENYIHANFPINKSYNIHFEKMAIMRIVLTYHRALDFTNDLYRAVHSYEKKHNCSIDFEVSIDETSVPTSPQAHFFIANELINRGINIASIAPRFCGEFQKGIDYMGDIKQFSDEIACHNAIADFFSYKISIHSGSDKFSIFPIAHKALGGKFHIKTSGTNWLVALQTIAHLDPELFRTIYEKAYTVFDTAKQYYHITPDFNTKEKISELTDSELDRIFENDCDRQVLHIAYGELFKIQAIKKRIDGILSDNIEAYWTQLNIHIGKHINLLLCSY